VAGTIRIVNHGILRHVDPYGINVLAMDGSLESGGIPRDLDAIVRVAILALRLPINILQMQGILVGTVATRALAALQRLIPAIELGMVVIMRRCRRRLSQQGQRETGQ
jgi:hypothetical protein